MRWKKKSVFICEALLCFICLFYANMDTDVFWSEPISYFSICSYGHNFIFSTQCSLGWLLIPIFAYVSLTVEWENEDKNSSFPWKRCIKGIVDFTIFFLIFVCILAFFSNRTSQESSWQIIAMKHAYGNLAENDNLAMYTFYCYLQLVVNLILWQLMVLIIEEVIDNESIIFISILIISYVWHCFIPYEWNYSVWMLPPIEGDVSLKILFLNSLVVILAEVGIIIILKYVARKTADVYKCKFFNKINAGSSILIGIICAVTLFILNAGFQDLFSLDNSILDIWLIMFGGIEWGHPNIIVEGAYRSTMCTVLPFIYDQNIVKKKGDTHCCEGAIGHSLKNTMFRMLIYIFFCIAIQLIVIWKNEISMGLLFDVNIGTGYWVVFSVLFIAHVLIMYNLRNIVFKMTNSMRISQLVWFIPFLGTLLASNEDRLINIYVPTNWPMIIRSNIFSPSYINEIVADGSEKLYYLATFSPIHALLGEITLLVVSTLIIWAINKKGQALTSTI